jgi:predicted nucleic acid-binding protein
MPDDLGVVPLAAPPPSVVVVDTSAVICALLGDQPQHEEYADFFERAIAAGTALVYCDLLDFELADVSMTIALKRRHGRAWFRHRGEDEALGAARDLMRAVFADWRKTLSRTSSARLPLGPIPERGEGSPVRDRAFELLESYPIRSYDAAHAGTAVLIDAPLVCRDVGFAALPRGLVTVITDSTRVGPSRRARSSNRR